MSITTKKLKVLDELLALSFYEKKLLNGEKCSMQIDWNSLSNHVVSAETDNTFKNCLDKFWSDQDVLYNYKTDLRGIGNRSTV